MAKVNLIFRSKKRKEYSIENLEEDNNKRFQN